MKEYTHDEIKTMLKFYDSPVGKKSTQKQEQWLNLPLVRRKLGSTELQAILMKYMQQ